MAETYEKVTPPTGTVQEIKIRTSTMASRYREEQPAVNRPTQDTLPDRSE